MSNQQELTDATKAQIKQEFEFFDKDQNGRIDLPEFVEMLTVLSPKTKVNRVEEGFAIIDTDSDGFISFNEFLDWWQDCWWEY